MKSGERLLSELTNLGNKRTGGKLFIHYHYHSLAATVNGLKLGEGLPCHRRTFGSLKKHACGQTSFGKRPSNGLFGGEVSRGSASRICSTLCILVDVSSE